MRAATAIGLAAVALSAFGSSAQEPFRAGTDVVPIYATVRGDDGHLVTNLEQGDFTIFDRDAAVPLAVFSNQPQPITVAVMIDMTGGFSADWHAELRQGLLAFIEELGPVDRARIGTFTGNEIAMGFHLTSVHAELRRVVSEEIWWWASPGGRPLWNAIGAGAESLADTPGRRVILVLANGPDNTSSLPRLPGQRQVEDTIRAGNYMVYALSLFGEGPRNAGPAGAVVNPSGVPALVELADSTGGGYVRALPGGHVQYWRGHADGLLAKQLAAIVDELRHQYALGFVPRLRDGKVGKIEVRVGRPNVTVSARKSYRAPESVR